jgi:hypothetical protein
MPLEGFATVGAMTAGASRLSEPQAQSPSCSRLVILASLGAMIGLGAFFLLGFNQLVPVHHAGWLLGPTKADPYYDTGTTFLGWHFFRHAPWKWPLTLNHSYGLEFGSSVVYSDSIPLLAVFFKIFSPWLGPVFQYVGLWVLVCFVLQGMFGALLGSRVLAGWVGPLIVSAFFALSPVMLERAWTEYPEMGHWIILWGLYLCLTPRNSGIRWAWLAPVFFAIGIEFYLTPMVLALWAADAMMAAIQAKKISRHLVFEAAAVCFTVFICMSGFGYLVLSSQSAATNDFGKFSMNLLGPVDPWDWSNFLKRCKQSPYHEGEGYDYMGLGVLVLAVMAIFSLFRNPPPLRRWLRIWPLVFVVAGLALFSLSNQIAVGDHVLILPNFWFRLGGIFRASGRMFWTPYYALWLGIFYLVTRELKPWAAALLLALAFGVQYADSAQMYQWMREKNEVHFTWRSPLKDPFWDAAVQKYREIVVVPSGYMLQYVPLAYLAANNNMSTNAVYVNRFAAEPIKATSAHRLQRLMSDQPSDRVLYIVPEQGRFDVLSQHLDSRHGFGQIDGYNVIAPYWLTDGKPAGPGNLKPGTAAAPR